MFSSELISPDTSLIFFPTIVRICRINNEAAVHTVILRPDSFFVAAVIDNGVRVEEIGVGMQVQVECLVVSCETQSQNVVVLDRLRRLWHIGWIRCQTSLFKECLWPWCYIETDCVQWLNPLKFSIIYTVGYQQQFQSLSISAQLVHDRIIITIDAWEI